MASESLSTAYDFQHWAMEALYTFSENLILAKTVYRNFENQFAEYGQTVNCRRPGSYDAYPKANGDAVTKQTPSASNVAVKLDQHLHVSIPFNDFRVSTSPNAMLNDFIRPMAVGLANQVERRVAAAAIRVPITQGVGRFGAASTGSNIYATLTQATSAMDGLFTPQTGRRIAHSTNFKNNLLNADGLAAADKTGDPSAVREGVMLRRMGFDMALAQNIRDVNIASCDYAVGAINLAAGYAAGHLGAMTVDTFSGLAGAVGCFATIAGDDTPLILSAVGASATTSITAATTPLKRAVANDAVVLVYQDADAAATYAVGYNKGIDIDGIASGKTLQVGQMLSYIVSSVRYTHIITAVTNVASTSCTVYLDRPLEAVLTNNDLVFPGPAGSVNMGYHRNGIALVVRPLVTVPGQQMSTVSFEDLSLRLSLTYDGSAQEQLLTMDCLCGVTPLDNNLIVPIWG